MGSTCRCTTFQVPSSGRDIIVIRTLWGLLLCLVGKSTRGRTISDTRRRTRMEENRNPLASNYDFEPLKMRKEVLWGLFEEHRAHARHTETLRSAVINMLIVASAVLVTLSTYDKILNTSDMPAAVLLVGFGILGTMFSLYHTEKIAKHKVRAAEYRNELDSTVLESPNGRKLAILDNRADAAFSKLLGDLAHRSKFMEFMVNVISRLDDKDEEVDDKDENKNSTFPRSLVLWSILPLFISLIGLSLIALIVGRLALVCLLGLIGGLLFFALRRGL
jgi:uncharacterized Tic20 family protein